MNKLFGGILLAVCLNAQTPTQVDWNTQVKNRNGYPITPNGGNTNGGYAVFSPVTYHPYDSVGACVDNWGNQVQQPLPANAQAAFGANDLVVWNSLSPSMPFNNGLAEEVTGLVQNVVIGAAGGVTGPGPCGIPLPVNQLYGMNTNGYWFGRAGLATDAPKYNSIQSLQGGVTANSFTGGVLYPTGTVTTTGTLVAPAYLGGHVDTGHSVGPPAAGTIATVTNPFSGGEGLVAGMEYFDDALHCEQVYGGAAWQCLSPAAGSTNYIQYKTGSLLDGSGNFTYSPSISALVVSYVGKDSGVIAPIFDVDLAPLSGTVTTVGTAVTRVSGLAFYAGMVGGNITITGAYYQVAAFIDASHLTLALSAGTQSSPVAYVFGNAIQTSTGTFQVTNGGYGLFQSVVAAKVFNSQADVNGGNAVQTSTGTFSITGAGDGLFQNLTVTNAFNSRADVAVSGLVTTSGTAVTWVSGSLFNVGMVGGNFTIGTVVYTVMTFTDTTHIVLTSSAGVQVGVAYSFGNAFQTSGGTYQFTGSGFLFAQGLKVTNTVEAINFTAAGMAGHTGGSCTAWVSGLCTAP